MADLPERTGTRLRKLSGRFYLRTEAGAAPRWQMGTMLIDERGYFSQFLPAQDGPVGGGSSWPQTTTTEPLWIFPGLCDVHCHVGIYPDQPDLRADLATTLAQARRNRDTGVLLIRDAGMITPPPAALTQNSALPVLLHCGRHLARPKRYLRGMSIDLTEPSLLPQAVAQQARVSNGWVKIVADWIDRAGGPEADLLPLWPTSILKEAVSAAHEAGARVTVHCFSTSAVEGLLAAGVDCIEHGCGMRMEHLQEAAQRGIPVTPTLLQVNLFPQFAAQAGKKYPRYAQTMMELYRGRKTHFQQLLASGVQLLPGTDAGGYQVVGSIGKELELWRYYGASPAQIADFATWKCRDFLQAGSLALAERADCLIYRADPTQSLETLLNPVRKVLLGRVY